MSAETPRVVLIDGTNALYRAFFAPMADLRAPDGTPTKAVLVFTNMLLKTLREEQPDYCVVVFDARGKTFRHDAYSDYKAGRDAQPEDLTVQMPLAREIVDALALPTLVIPDFEADDVIATLVRQAPKHAQVSVVSTDKDLMQLVDDRVQLLDGIRDRRYTPAEVEKRFGVPPAKVLDLRALVGDKSDNIPGVKGIGEKGAAKLIEEWGDLETLLDHVGEIEAKRAREALSSHADDARLSKELARLREDVPLDGDFDAYRRREPDRERLRDVYRRLGFVRLVEALDAERPDADRPSAASDVAVETLSDAAGLAAFAKEVATLPSVTLFCVDSGGSVMAARPLGVAIAASGDRAFWVRFAEPGFAEPGFAEPGVGDAGLDFEAFAQAVAPVLSGDVAWVGVDAKRTRALLAEQGAVLPPPWFDIDLAGRLVDYSGPQGVAALAIQHLGREIATWEELAGRGAKAKAPAEIPAGDLARWAGCQAAAAAALRAPLEAQLEAQGQAELFDEVELPLTVVLGDMERDGVRVDETVLETLSTEYAAKLDSIEQEIHDLAGEPFLISSPKQLQHILFEKLKLPPVKKTKTGFSTDESVLEQLAAKHELPARILAYRRLSKLVNTYIDALPPLIDEATGRVHPTYNQLGAATGRLSATHPNVQNIPIRSEEGIRIREAFVPAEGCLLASADYSQVELRILAHYSRDEGLREAFRDGDDIHRRTASEVWEVAQDDVSADQRARAKAVNFGIIYGLSAFGLANQLGIASAEAQETIDAYFARYAGVKSFIEGTIEAAKRDGSVRTLLGRRRVLPDITSRNRGLRQAAERMAVNTVVQGTAADLIKRAMLAVSSTLRESGSGARIVLQVHDELVLEVPERKIDEVRERVASVMEGVLPLSVPLRVDVGVGRNWREAH